MESLREVLGFFSNQIDLTKFQIKQPAKRFIDGTEIEVKMQDEFLNQNEFAEIKGAYDDYQIGDLTIVFVNPDYENCPNKAINFEIAERVFDEILTVMSEEGVSKVQLKKEKESFLLSFLTLKDYKEIEKAKKVKRKKKKENEIENEKLKNFKRSTSKLRTEVYDEDKKNKKKKKGSYFKYLEFMSNLKKNEEIRKAQEQEKLILDTKKGEGYLEDIGVELDKKDMNQQIMVDPIKELLKVKVFDKNQFKRVKKSFSQGGFLIKKNIDQEDYEWICANDPPNDFLTLVRFTIMSKLSRNGLLHCRTFVSMTGQHIFLVLKSSQKVIARQAQLMRLTKQIEMGYADLFSLEPVDSLYRPLRLKNNLRKLSGNDDIRERMKAFQENMRGKSGNSNMMKDLVEDHCRALYQKVCQWNSIDLKAHLILKQQEADKYLKIIAKDLNIDMSHEKVEIIDDSPTSDEEWQAYYIYMEYIVRYGQIMENLKQKDYFQIRDNLAFIYKLIFRKAVGDANEFWYDRNFTIWRELRQDRNILKTLWNRLNVEPVAPYTDYFSPINESGNAMWRKYEINEKGERSEFLNMEKIKITHQIVLKNLNILKLLNQELAFAYFPIHDHYQLRGISKDPFFVQMKDAEFMNQKIETAGDLELKRLFNQLKDEAESTDFDAESLEKESAFNFQVPWYVPIATIRNYYGEKIALYFDFVSYYTKQLWYMGILGIVAQGMLSSSNENIRGVIIIIFALSVIIWSTFFIEFWKREQVLFSVQYGQENFEEDEAERPAFKGVPIRSITNDNLNEEYYSPFSRKMKQLTSLGVSFLIIGIVIACVYGIFQLKSDYVKEGQTGITIMYGPSALNSIQIFFFNQIYQIVVKKFNNLENHKILSSYENALIAKVFIFMFFNNFNSFFIISFLSGFFPNLNLCVTASFNTDSGKLVEINDCFTILENQMLVVFLSTVVKNIPEILIPIGKALIVKRTKQVDEKPVIHPFNLIDNVIEDQLELEAYLIDQEVDGTVNDYMELVIQFAYLCLFGLAFPICYFIAFLTSILEIQVDKLKLIRFVKRPLPQGASTIGNWLMILEVITFLGIFTNAGLIVYTSDYFQSEGKIIIFAVLLITFLALKYFIRFLVPDEPEAAIILNRRHQHVVDKVIKGFQAMRKKTYIPTRLNTHLGGVEYNRAGDSSQNLG